MIESYIIRILLNYTYYSMYRYYIDINSLESETIKIIRVIDRIFKLEKNTDISKEDLLIRFQTEYPTITGEELETYINIITLSYDIEVDLDKDYEILINIIKKNYINKLYQYLLQGIVEPTKVDFNFIDDLLCEYNEVINKITDMEEEEDDSFDIEKIMESKEGDTIGYKWPTIELQEALGNIKGGDLGKIVATPEAGKSALALTIGIHVAKQGGKVVHWNNEERKTKIMKRAFEVACNTNAREFKYNYAKYNKIFKDTVGDRWILKDSNIITISDIKKSIIQYKPDLVIIDQSAKIKVKDLNRQDLTLSKIDLELRNLCKKYNVHIIGISQADATAFQKQYITMNCINGSNIAVQGELDYMIGVNWKNDINSDPNLRYISTPKNKVGQKPEAKFVLYLDRDTNIYKSLDEIE